MAKTTTVRKDLIPYRAGVVILTPLDANKKPDYSKAVATEYDFLTSTQTSVTRTTESLPNGNGQDKEYVTDESYTVTVIGNTYNPVFHAVATGRIESLPDEVLVWEQFTYNLPETVAEGGVLEITFGEGKNHEALPAADADGNYNFIVEDSYGNTLTRSKQAVVGSYVYDEDTQALQFAGDYKGAAIRVIFQKASTDALVYTSNPILQQPEYQVDVFGVSMSAGTDDKYQVITQIKRATVTGDVSDQTTQKAKSAPITYTIKSTPVPEGVSVYTQIITPIASAATATGNIVNGGDDNFGDTTTGGNAGGDDQGEVEV